MSYAEKRKGKLTGRFIGERVVAGKVLRMRSSVKAEADKWERVIDATGTPPIDTAVSVPFSIGAVAKEARAQRKGWKGSRDTSLDQRLEVALEFFGAFNSVTNITYDRMLALVKHLETTHKGRSGAISPKTVNRYLSVVSALLDFARELGSAHAPKIPWQEETEGRIGFLSKQQEAEVARHLSGAEQFVMERLIKTGMRAGEFFNIEPEDIDISDNRSAWVRLWADETKNSAMKSVPMDHDTARQLKALLEAGELPTHHEFYVAFKAACAKAGLSPELCVHSLRHTTGTRLARLVKPALVQKFMGHRTYRTTEKYIHLNDDDMLEAAEALG